MAETRGESDDEFPDRGRRATTTASSSSALSFANLGRRVPGEKEKAEKEGARSAAKGDKARPKTTRRRKRSSVMLVNLDHTKYNVIVECCAKMKWKVTTEDEPWNIWWQVRLQ